MGDVIAIVGADLRHDARPNVRRVYNGFGCNVCGLICGWVDSDGRCQTCVPVPTAQPARSDIERERAFAERIRRNRS